MIRIGLLAHLADPDDLATETAEPAHEDVAERPDPLADPDLALVDDDPGLIDALEARRHHPDLRLDVAAGVEDGIPHEHGRARRRRLLVVRHDRGVAHDDGHPVERGAELLRGDLGKDRPGALAHVRRPGRDDHAAVREEPNGRIREAGRRA